MPEMIYGQLVRSVSVTTTTLKIKASSYLEIHLSKERCTIIYVQTAFNSCGTQQLSGAECVLEEE